MSEDEKLLMLAAKAEGREPPIDANGVFGAWVGSMESGHWWNPLEDDGDALRLAVKMKMCVDVALWSNDVQVRAFKEDCGMHHIDEEGADILSATRRAIVRAAAEIGKATA